MAKLNKERQREYRERKKLGPSTQKVAKTAAQRQREKRQRQRGTKNILTIERKTAKTSRERVRYLRERRQVLNEAPAMKMEGGWLQNYFEKEFYSSTLDAICDVCDRIWWTDDVIINDLPKVRGVLVENGYIDRESFILCRTCNTALMKGRLPNLATCNGFVYPPIPPDLPELDPISERLISPRLPFLRIQQIRFYQHTKQLIGQIINVPVDINDMVTKLPREDDMIINVELKKRLLHKSSFYRGYVRKGVVRDWLKYLINTPLYKMHNVQIDNSFWGRTDKTLREETLEMASYIPNVVSKGDEAKLSAEGLMSLRQQTLMCDDALNLILAPGQDHTPNAISFDEDAEELSFPSIYYGVPRRYTVPTTPFMMITSELRRSDRRGVVPEKILYAAAKIMRLRVIQGFQHLFRNQSEEIKCITRQQLLDPGFVRESLERNMAFMQTVPNSMQYWSSKKRDLFAMMRQLGKPTIFMTLSASEVHCPGLLRTLLQVMQRDKLSSTVTDMTDEDLLNMTVSARAELVNNDPVTCNLYFNRLVSRFIRALKKVQGPFKKHRIIDFFKRIEFQHRGSAHCHMLLWLADVPDETRGEDMPRTTEMIDGLMTTDRAALISERPFQTHRHTFTCEKGKTNRGECRFGAPFWPMRETRILMPAKSDDKSFKRRFDKIHAIVNTRVLEDQPYEDIDQFIKENAIESEEEYIDILRHGIKRPTVFLRRNVEDVMTNSFNPDIAEILQSNMDIQFILDEYSCAAYVAEYVNKSDRGFSSLHRELVRLRDEFPDKDYEHLVKEVGKRALNKIEMSSQEAAWFLLRIPMSQCSREVRYIPTQHPSQRVVTRKSRAQMDREYLSDDSTDVWTKNVIQKYESRPGNFESLNLADFVSEYTWYKKKRLNSEEGACENLENFVVSEEENCDDSVQVPILDSDSITLRRRKRPAVIRYCNYKVDKDPLNYKRECVTLFHPFRNEELDILNRDAYLNIFDENEERLLEARKKYDCGMDLEKVIELARAQYDPIDEAERDKASEERGPGTELSKDMEDYMDCKEADERDVDFKVLTVNSIVRKVSNLRSHAEFCELMRTLNDEQRALLLEIIFRLVYAQELGPLQIFFTGPAGSGKSFVLRIIMEVVNRFVLRHDTTKNAYIACATTGKAAVNIDGQTIHSVFKLSFNPKRLKGFTAGQMQSMRCDLRDVVYIIIDEISMASSAILQAIDSKLRAIRDPNLPFGGFNMVLCGDLRQLPPVRALPPYARQPNLLESNMVWQNLLFYGLETVVRQEDKTFSTLLTKVGTGDKLTRKEQKLIESRFFKPENVECLSDAIRIFLTNKEVDEYNEKVLSVDGCVISQAIDSVSGFGEYEISEEQRKSTLKKLAKMVVSETGNMCRDLKLVVGRPYMVTQNTRPDDKIVNGSLGYLRGIEYARDESGGLAKIVKRLWMEFEDQSVGAILRARFKHYAKEWNIDKNWTPISRRETVVDVRSRLIRVRRQQFPVVPACAITVHKSQGQTYDRVVYEYSRSHDTQLTYVALSRAKSLEGLFLTNKSGDFTFHHAKPRDNLKLKTELTRLETKRLITVVDNAQKFLQDHYLSCGYLNVQSLRAHWPDLVTDQILKKCQVFAMSETWMEDTDEAVEIPGFRCAQRHKRPKERVGIAGGVAIYESLVSKLEACTPITNDYFKSDNGDICCALMEFQGRTVALVCIYASVGIGFRKLCHLMDCALLRFNERVAGSAISQDYNLSQCPVIVCGDLNCDLKKPEGLKLLEYISDYHGVKLAIDNSISTTRNNTCIDYVFTKGVEDLNTLPYVSYFGVHRPIICGIGSTDSSESMDE